MDFDLYVGTSSSTISLKTSKIRDLMETGELEPKIPKRAAISDIKLLSEGQTTEHFKNA